MDNPFEISTNTVFFSQGFPVSTEWLKQSTNRLVNIPLANKRKIFGWASNFKVGDMKVFMLCFPDEGYAASTRVGKYSVYEDRHLSILSFCSLARAMCENGLKVDLKYFEDLKKGGTQ